MSAICRRSWPNMSAISTTGARIDRWDNGRLMHRYHARLIETLKLERSSRYLCSEVFITFISNQHDDGADLILAPYTGQRGVREGEVTMQRELIARLDGTFCISVTLPEYSNTDVPLSTMEWGQCRGRTERRRSHIYAPARPPMSAPTRILTSASAQPSRPSPGVPGYELVGFAATRVDVCSTPGSCLTLMGLAEGRLCAVSRCSKQHPYSITSSARASSEGGTVRPSAFAVLRLTTSSNLVGCSIGKLEGLAPFRIRSTKF